MLLGEACCVKVKVCFGWTCQDPQHNGIKKNVVQMTLIGCYSTEWIWYSHKTQDLMTVVETSELTYHSAHHLKSSVDMGLI